MKTDTLVLIITWQWLVSLPVLRRALQRPYGMVDVHTGSPYTFVYVHGRKYWRSLIYKHTNTQNSLVSLLHSWLWGVGGHDTWWCRGSHNFIRLMEMLLVRAGILLCLLCCVPCAASLDLLTTAWRVGFPIKGSRRDPLLLRLYCLPRVCP